MTVLTPIERIIAKLLVDSAIHKKGNYSYSEISEVIEKEYGETVNPHYGLSKPLGNIAILCNELGLPLLSVRVQYKNSTSSSRTAEGFYSIACELKPEYKSMEPNDVRRKELELTRTCTEWQRLLDYLDDKPTMHTKNKPLTFPEQLALFVDDVIARSGIGHIVTTQEINKEIIQQFGTNPDSITFYDYCYNRISKNLSPNRPLYFEYLGTAQYRVWGKDHPCNGEVFARPQKGTEHPAGYCIDGRQYLGKLPVYPDETPDDSPEYREGKKKSVIVNTFERNPAARLLCINHYGAVCAICGFDFGKTYGLECEGMIHVHHLKMISEADREYVVDPINDLRPVCPNCHMVLHSKKEGYEIAEVQAMIKR